MNRRKAQIHARLRAAIGLSLCAMVLVALTPGSALADDEFFEKQIRPILVERCQSCHGEQKPKGGLRLTSRDMLLRGGDTGPAISPGKPERESPDSSRRLSR